MPNRLILSFTLACLTGCGNMANYTSQTGRQRGETDASNAPQTRPVANTNATNNMNNQESGDISTEGNEDEQASPPTAVSGAFLSDCRWLEDDAASSQGIGGCLIKDNNQKVLTLEEIEIKSLILAVNAEQHNVSALPGTAGITFKFPIDYKLYGASLSIALDFTWQGEGGGESIPNTITVSSTITGIPTPTNEFALGAFALGDSPKAASCQQIRTRALGLQQTGPQFLEIIFTVASDNQKLELTLKELCGHGQNPGTQNRKATWQIVDSTGNPIFGPRDLPLSSSSGYHRNQNNDRVIDVTESTSGPLGRGEYTLKIAAGTYSGGGVDLIDDISAEDIIIKFQGIIFKDKKFN